MIVKNAYRTPYGSLAEADPLFTGIVQQVGTVASLERNDFGAVLCVDPRGWGHVPEPAESIAVNGCCLTVASVEPAPGSGKLLAFDVVPQTLRCTTLDSLRGEDAVNLEPAVTPTTMLGGHVVQGHIDGVGEVSEIEKSQGEWRVAVRCPEALLPYVVEKGSIAVDGVSLTVAALRPDGFEVALIPTTLRMTTLGDVEVGRSVNLETDYLVKAVVGWLERKGRTES